MQPLRSVALVLAMAIALPVWCKPAAANGRRPRVLSHVDSVRGLPLEEASRSLQVRLNGVITAFSGYKNSFFLQDDTAGISVDRTDHAMVKLGDRVELTGVSNAGGFAPVVLASKVVALGRGVQPVAKQVTYVDLIGGAEDSQRIEVRGVVHAAKIGQLFDKDVLNLSLDVGAAAVTLLVQDYAGLATDSLIDATVRVRGVCSSSFNKKRQFVGAALFVPSLDDIIIERVGAGNPFDRPTMPISGALRFGQAQHRVKVAGIVTWQVPGKLLYIQDGEEGIRVDTSSWELAAPGTRVEVVGFPGTGAYSPILKEGLFRVVGGPIALTPPRIAATDVVKHNGGFNDVSFDAQLVEIEGQVIETRNEGTERVFLLRQGLNVFEARQTRSPANANRRFENGSMVLLTGICAIVAGTDRTPTGFAVLLRSDSDMVLLKRAPWWNPVHALAVLVALAAATMLVMLWVVVLRNRVEQQTRMIRESENRYRYLAEHDALTGLLNRLMLEERLSEALASSSRDGLHAAIFTIDIDHFKRINDTHGHLVGDEILKVVATRLTSAVRRVDTVARTGGEEFTIVAGSLAEADSANRISSAILQKFRQPVILPGQEIAVTVSVGCALFPANGKENDELRKRSDQALYEAKRTGRNRVVFAAQAGDIEAVAPPASNLLSATA